MKSKLPLTFLPLFFTNAFGEQGLYYTGTEAQESLPIKWLVGGNVIYDDNVNPTSVDPSTGRQSAAESSMAVNPYVGASFVNLSPQTTLDVYGKLGMVYYFDAPDGINEINSQFNYVSAYVDKDGDINFRYALVFDKKLEPKIVHRWLKHVEMQSDAILNEFGDQLKPFLQKKSGK